MEDAEVAAFANVTSVKLFGNVSTLSCKLGASFRVVAVSAKTECIIVGVGMLTLRYFAFFSR